MFLFDLDHTLVIPRSGKKFPVTVDDRAFIEGRWEHLLDLHEQGKKTAICTNQGGAAWGIFQPEEMDKFLAHLCKSGDIDKFFVCYRDTSEKARNSERTIKELTVPEYYKGSEYYKGDWNRRKPGPGMLIEAMDYFGIPWYDTLYVGDRQEDKDAAEAAGCNFEWEWSYFKREKE